MYVVVLIILIAIFAILLYVGTKRIKSLEGFYAMSEHINFAKKQDTYYHESLDKAIFKNPGMNILSINNALKIPDLSIYYAKFKDYIPKFMEERNNAYEERDKEFCKKARHPRNLPKRKRRSVLECGWYFTPDNTQASVGVLGSRYAPLFTDGLPANGTWIWDLNEAIEKEDIKFCSNIRSCDLMDIDGIRGVCGFCLLSGRGVPINPNGQEKYPNNPDASCGIALSKTAYQCANPPPKPVYTTEGVNCRKYGYASKANDIRLYNKSDCDSLAGKWVKNGECLKPKGGSFSWDCRSLNLPKPVYNSICTANNQGLLTRECLLSLAKGVGMLPTGSIMYMIKKSVEPTAIDKQAMRILASIGIAIPPSVLGNGNTDLVTAGNTYKRIMDQVQRGNTEQVRNAALLLAVGNSLFDLCEQGGTVRGPFSKDCAQMAFRRAGCQAGGKSYPTTDITTDKTWGELTQGYKQLYSLMNDSSEPESQKNAILQCLGITVPDVAVGCGK